MMKKSPYYYFNANRFLQNIDALKERLSDRVKVCFSIKSNPFMAVYAAKYADYVEVCSEGEYELCIGKINPAKIVVGGVYKSVEWIKTLVQNDVFCISVESMTQLEQLGREVKTANKRKNVLLRLSSSNQFGMAEEEILQVLRQTDQYPGLRFCGIHYYSGTQKKKPEKIREDLMRIREVLQRSNFTDPCIEYGPGIGTFLYGDSKDPWYLTIYEEMISEINQLAEQYQVTLELGRVLTADIGKYITTVVDRKQIKDRIFYIVDGGIHHLSYYGQQAGYPNPKIRVPKKGDQETETVTICGSLCTASDILAKDITLPRAEIGDRIAFLNTGAYSVTEARALFLSHKIPEVWILDKDREYRARQEKETYLINTIEECIMEQKIYNKVVNCIKSVMKNKEQEIRPESRLQEDLLLESIHILMLQVALEEVFYFQFDPMEDNFRQIFATVKSVSDYVSEHV